MGYTKEEVDNIRDYEQRSLRMIQMKMDPFGYYEEQEENDMRERPGIFEDKCK